MPTAKLLPKRDRLFYHDKKGLAGYPFFFSKWITGALSPVYETRTKREFGKGGISQTDGAEAVRHGPNGKARQEGGSE